MSETVPVTFDLDPETAAALDDAPTRARVLHLIRRSVRPDSFEPLFDAMDALSSDATRRGLTDEILDRELSAHKAERSRTPRTA